MIFKRERIALHKQSASKQIPVNCIQLERKSEAREIFSGELGLHNEFYLFIYLFILSV